jgi:branched-chain amino acid transport system substrate-binding protein
MVRARGLVVLSLVALAAFACSSGSTGGGNTNKGTIKIGVSLPLSGASASDGQPTLKGAEYAIQKQGGTLDGFTLKIDSLDYAPAGTIDATIGKNNMLSFVADSQVLAVMGPFNSSVARQQIPVANQANLTMVSPANTNPCLTVDLKACHFPVIGFWPSQLRAANPDKNNYFRVAASDLYQGGAAADYAYTTLGLKTVGVFDDETSYGIGIAEYFAEHFCNLGGTVVGGCAAGSSGGVAGIKHYDPTSTTSFTALLNSLKAGGAQGIYAGGNASEKLCVARNQSKGIFASDSAFLMGDGGTDAECLDTAGAQGPGMVGTVAAEDQSKLPPAAATVISGFKSAMGSGPTDFGAYTIPAYAATQTIIAGLDKAIKANGGNMPTREQVRMAMTQLSPVDTPLGSVTFDKNGDTTQQVIAFYKAGAKGSGQSELTCGATNTSVCWEFLSSKNYSGSTYP